MKPLWFWRVYLKVEVTLVQKCIKIFTFIIEQGVGYDLANQGGPNHKNIYIISMHYVTNIWILLIKYDGSGCVY